MEQEHAQQISLMPPPENREQSRRITPHNQIRSSLYALHGPLMLVYLTHVPGKRVVLIQVNWIGVTR